jgi:predicted metalloendopeptidase
VRIPDDESAKSQFGIIDDELEVQLRDILEANETEHDSSTYSSHVFTNPEFSNWIFFFERKKLYFQ